MIKLLANHVPPMVNNLNAKHFSAFRECINYILISIICIYKNLKVSYLYSVIHVFKFYNNRCARNSLIFTTKDMKHILFCNWSKCNQKENLKLK
jgi:hypothetical protein